jgi:hypothetical protein
VLRSWRGPWLMLPPWIIGPLLGATVIVLLPIAIL